MTDVMTKTRGRESAPDRMRRLIREVPIMFFPTCHDALTARLIQQAGFPCTLFSGFGVAAARFGLPDVGLVTQTEMADQLRSACLAAPGLPMIADGDTGYGNAMSVRRTVDLYAGAGAAAIMLEDQVSPKRCGHMAGAREVVSHGEAMAKIRAAIDARAERDILIMARTDARGPLGFEAALDRCLEFEELGADIVFMEAPQTEEELGRFAGSIKRAATLANIGPKTPDIGRAKLKALGFKFVTYNVLLPTIITGVQKSLRAVLDDAPDAAPEMADFAEMTGVVGLPEYQQLDSRYAVDA